MTKRLPKLSSCGFSFLSFIFFSFLSFSASAQILNTSFEDTRPNGSPAHWGRIVLQPFPCTLAQGYDSVYFRVKDPHTGSYALEMRNAHCDNSSFFAGSAILMEVDTNYFGQGVPFAESPAAVSFFYKLLPVGGDIGHVSIQLVDDISGIMVADAEFDITQPSPNYALQTVPLTYYDNATPTRITIMFSIVNNTSHVNFGTRFLVDDVSATTTGINSIKGAKSALVLYPNPSQGTVTIKAVDTTPVQLEVYNTTGQLVMNSQMPVNTPIDIQTLPAGLYSYRIISNTKLTCSGKLLRN